MVSLAEKIRYAHKCARGKRAFRKAKSCHSVPAAKLLYQLCEQGVNCRDIDPDLTLEAVGRLPFQCATY